LEVLRHYTEWTDRNGSPELDSAIARYTSAQAAGRDVREEVPSGPYLEIPATFSVPQGRLEVCEVLAHEYLRIRALILLYAHIPRGQEAAGKQLLFKIACGILEVCD
jgi:hypothetical protein